MNLLIKSVQLLSEGHPFHRKECDVYVENGVYKKFATGIDIKECARDTQVYDAEDQFLSIGWMDMRVNFREPGHEQKETIASGLNAAAAGGFTAVLLMPSTNPSLQTRADIEFVKSKSQSHVTTLYPAGSLTLNREGKELCELYDMQQGGAVAFTDDKKFLKDSGVMMRALQYAGNISSRVITYADDEYLSGNSLANESATTTLLGFKGSPALAEEIALQRELSLCNYTNTALHVSGISTAGAVNVLREAKKRGANVTAEVYAHHLVLTDESLNEFDSNYKVKPPLRSQEDVEALRKAVADGTIDVIVSDHSPQDIESKDVEYDNAGFGMIGLETSFAVLHTALKDLPLEKIIACISTNPRKILGLPAPLVKEGEEANFTLFNPQEKWTFSKEDIYSLSRNTPFVGAEFKGRAKAVYANRLFFQAFYKK